LEKAVKTNKSKFKKAKKIKISKNLNLLYNLFPKCYNKIQTQIEIQNSKSKIQNSKFNNFIINI